MPLLNSVINWFNIKRRNDIELFKKHPYQVQLDTLTELLAKAKSTVWGKQYGYSDIKSIEEYQARVPVSYYEDIAPYIDRLIRGEQNVLWPSEIKWFAKSSGTTNDKSKFIPVSKESLEGCHFRAGKDVLAFYTANFPDTRLFSGKSLTLGGSHQINQFNMDSFYGDLSAILIENIPFWADFLRTPSQKIALIPEWERKLEELTKATIKENVTSIAGVPSWNLVMIKYILEYTGKSNLLDVWPNLELFTHGGVSFKPYRDQFRKVIPSDTMNYMETYNASEGFFGIQNNPDSDDMLLMLDYGIFYEFVPMEDIDNVNPRFLNIGDVEENKNYAMVISTNSGLWRYMIGDTVTFTSLYPHKIKITGRTKHYINAFGEELMIDNAERALDVACNKTGAQINEYTVAPVYMTNRDKGKHQWLIEFNKHPNDLGIFIDCLDNALKSLNSDYEAKRYNNVTLDTPVIDVAKNKLFFDWMSSRGKLGGQNKVPRLSNDRTYMDQLLAMNE
jgi:hypothetical protein